MKAIFKRIFNSSAYKLEKENLRIEGYKEIYDFGMKEAVRKEWFRIVDFYGRKYPDMILPPIGKVSENNVGYDIQSFLDHSIIYIQVSISTRRVWKEDSTFYLTQTEYNKMLENPHLYYIRRVYNINLETEEYKTELYSGAYLLNKAGLARSRVSFGIQDYKEFWLPDKDKLNG